MLIYQKWPIVSYILNDVRLKLSKKKTVDKNGTYFNNHNLAEVLLQPYVLLTLQIFFILLSVSVAMKYVFLFYLLSKCSHGELLKTRYNHFKLNFMILMYM